MKAIILVAGYASRLYPLTSNTPKALLTLNGMTMLDFVLGKLDDLDNIDEIILVSNNKYHTQFLEWKKSYTGKRKITILNDETNTNDTRLGAIGDLQFAIEKLSIDDEIIVLPSDNYFTFSLKDFYDFYREKQADCLIVTKFDDLDYLGKNFACVKIDKNDRIIDMIEKPGYAPDTNMGAYACYLYRKDTVGLIKEYLDGSGNSDAPGNFPTWLYTKKPVYGFRFNGECYDIGTFEILNKVKSKFENIKK